jgi:hypothetical protein
LQNLFQRLSFLATSSTHLHREVFIFNASPDFQSESVPHL